jgi:hypothetical protein
MTSTRAPLTVWQRSAALAAAVLIGLALLALGWRAAAAQAPAAPAGTIWFVNNTPGEGLVGYWKFDQVTNTTTVNSALLTNAASLANGASISFTSLPPLGIPNFRKLVLNGTNQYLVVPDAPQLDVAPDHFSLAAWVRRTTVGTSDLIYDSGENLHHWYFGFLASDSKLTFSLNGLADVRSNHVVTDANWHHVAAVKNGSGPGNLLIYLDGVASIPLTVTVSAAPTGTKTIGIKNVLFNTPFAGDLDDLRLYNRALSAAEVARLAQGRGCVTDGQSWANAFADLQCALDVAAGGDEIWVAKSFEPYRPGTSEFARFNLVSGVGVFGNFQGTETNRAQRPPVNFEQFFVTRLSGDLLDDDGGGNFSGNARNVVDAAGTGPGTVFDGLRVEAGFNPDLIGGGGGGLRLHASGQLTVANSLFISNRALEGGAALLASSGQIGLDNVIFDSNTGPTGGAAILLGRAVITGGEFRNNTAQDCGALFANSTAITITGTRFDFNQASGQGGAICNINSLVLDGAVFESNRASLGGALHTVSPMTVTNSQFLTNTAGDGGGLFATQDLRIQGGLFAGNTATRTLGQGGAISVTGPLALGGATFVAIRPPQAARWRRPTAPWRSATPSSWPTRRSTATAARCG